MEQTNYKILFNIPIFQQIQFILLFNISILQNSVQNIIQSPDSTRKINSKYHWFKWNLLYLIRILKNGGIAWPGFWILTCILPFPSQYHQQQAWIGLHLENEPKYSRKANNKWDEGNLRFSISSALIWLYIQSSWIHAVEGRASREVKKLRLILTLGCSHHLSASSTQYLL